MSWREVFPRAGYAALFFSAGDSGKIGRAPDAAACGPGGMRPVVVWPREELIAALTGLGDMERLIGRIVYGTAGGRDMVSLRRCCVRPSGPSL